ncbi:uncharacterized protein LOC114737982 [Neltuma alba]|uniref:uncharacterized protein LOC114737982 n=1 Tax=Neltuma alba TaxID=207710 RepID=UPI0010A41603|nr:uncharacterized protein LOC114737982 [Prosopis alba]
MASLIHKISRNSTPSFRVLSAIKPPTILRRTDSPIPLETLPGTRLPDPTSSAASFLSLSDYKPNSSQSLGFQFFPSFPFGFCCNPVVSAESENFGGADTPRIEDDEARTIWADSVKRKRKRKMNKHKYKKLRKRLRRKT